ncbi:sulfite exporter TauE/SafE family protein [Hydromonas duriensis]|uniref:Probable membrane transporter protein n=1 Tax=Hydromonas duriensis TaxID=1527608 RepID=A0A4R6YA64_9BURK|nr:sulfite exporter TauE/SafE family protein [Hydromonas duriensis]TDR32395.1 hypothetical protein DFR44_104114 [Hydromonas duriensis]
MFAPDFFTLLLLLITGFIAGVCNAIAGGGTFFTLPIFLAAGLPPVLANASNAVAVWPGHILASVGYRDILLKNRQTLFKASLIGLVGALIGAYVLLTMGNARFRVLIPFLILLATLLFAFGARIRSYFNSRVSASSRHFSLDNPNVWGVLIQLVLAIYGGFFSAGLGVMLMAMLMLFGVHDIQLNNAYKNAIASVISTVAVMVFISQGLVVWSFTLPAFVAGVVGGIVGARVARFLPAQLLKNIVVGTGIILCIYYVVKLF